jgi:hypothetical protein
MYRAADARLYRLGESGTLLVPTDGTAGHYLDRQSALVWKMCRGSKSFEEHLAGICQQLGIAEREEVSGVLQLLISQGCLRAVAAQDKAPAAANMRGRIATFVIPTRDRPIALERCVRSYLRACEGRSTDFKILVIDGSASLAMRRANLEALSRLAVQTPVAVHCIAASQREMLKATLDRGGAKSQLLDFTVTSPALSTTTGDSRNLALLLNAGEAFLSVDDDTVCQPWTMPDAEPGVAFWGDRDPVEMQFVNSRSEADAATLPSTVNIVEALEALLGKTLLQCAEGALGEPVWSDCCEHLHNALAGKSGSERVRVCFPGMAGDVALHCPYQLLFSSGATRRLMSASNDAFETALTSREAVAAVRRYTVTDNSTCITMCAALDNEDLLPPFVPVGRNQDGVFGVMLRVCDPGALFGYVPYGIRHASDRAPKYDDGAILSASGIRWSDLLILLLKAAPVAPMSRSVRRRTIQIGEFFQELASLDRVEFVRFVEAQLLLEWHRRLSAMDVALRGERSYPEYWLQGFEKYRNALCGTLTRPHFCVPFEFQDAAPEHAYAAVQRCLQRYGELLQEWPDLWQSAREARLAGRFDEVVGPPVKGGA